MQFLICDYHATGEGRTVCILITKACPKQEDYISPSYYENDVFCPGQLGNSEKFRAAREFLEIFGGFYTRGAENLPKEEFFQKYSKYLPSFLEKIVEEDAGNISYHMQLHVNFS